MLTAASLVFLCATASGFDDSIHLTLLPKGASAKAGYYAPQRANLSEEKPASLKKAPDDLKGAKYAELPLGPGDAKTVIALEEHEGKPARLFVDTNGNGDLTDDQPAEWTGKEGKANDQGQKFTMYNGGAMVSIGESAKPMQVHLNMYRFDPTDPGRAGTKNVILFYRDYGYEGEVKLGAKAYKALLLDESASGDFRGKTEGKDSGVKLLLDINADGKFDSRRESFDSKKPFNIGGTTYELADMTRTGDAFKVVKSKETVAEILPGPDHSVGKKITAFEAKSTDGKAIKFPGDYKGKVVLIDFWATWCGPCMKEMPNVVETYKKLHSKGFEIQGVSLDNEKTLPKMEGVMKEQGMTWSQIADGKFWQAEIAVKYDIHSIPATFLVDGDTGEILGANLRGEALGKAVEKALTEKKGKS